MLLAQSRTFVPPGRALPFGLLQNWMRQSLWKFPMLPGSPVQAELAQNLTVSMANGPDAYDYNGGFIMEACVWTGLQRRAWVQILDNISCVT